MFKRLFIVLMLLSISQTVHAGDIDKTVDAFCSTLVGKDIISIHTRPIIEPFFISEKDLSNFIVYLNIRMQKDGFKRFTVLGCKVKKIENNGLNADAELEIAGEGPIFFLKRHLLISTLWLNKDGKWYIEAPSTINDEQ
ncbi:MAG: hypothetical protein ACP5JP_03445 [bacterium]